VSPPYLHPRSSHLRSSVRAGKKQIPMCSLQSLISGRVERRRDPFRPMASGVSALSSIVANSSRVMPSAHVAALDLALHRQFR
jgi:hypothetical protein